MAAVARSRSPARWHGPRVDTTVRDGDKAARPRLKARDHELQRLFPGEHLGEKVFEAHDLAPSGGGVPPYRRPERSCPPAGHATVLESGCARPLPSSLCSRYAHARNCTQFRKRWFGLKFFNPAGSLGSIKLRASVSARWKAQQ